MAPALTSTISGLRPRIPPIHGLAFVLPVTVEPALGSVGLDDSVADGVKDPLNTEIQYRHLRPSCPFQQVHWASGTAAGRKQAARKRVLRPIGTARSERLRQRSPAAEQRNRQVDRVAQVEPTIVVRVGGLVARQSRATGEKVDEQS